MSSKRIAIMATLSLFGMLSLFALGLACFALFFLDHVRVQAINALMDQSGVLWGTGGVLVSFSLALSALLLYLFKGKTLHVELKLGSMCISKPIVEKALFGFWENEIAQPLPQIAILKSNTIEIQCPQAMREKIESMESAIFSHLISKLGFAPKIHCVFSI